VKKPTSSRVRVRAAAPNDDGQEKTNDDEGRTASLATEKVESMASEHDDGAVQTQAVRVLREATLDEDRVLAICWQWQCGVSMPMPADLVELYRAMRPAHDLPKRPGT
jgi:hypothetical protein